MRRDGQLRRSNRVVLIGNPDVSRMHAKLHFPFGCLLTAACIFGLPCRCSCRRLWASGKTHLVMMYGGLLLSSPMVVMQLHGQLDHESTTWQPAHTTLHLPEVQRSSPVVISQLQMGFPRRHREGPSLGSRRPQNTATQGMLNRYSICTPKDSQIQYYHANSNLAYKYRQIRAHSGLSIVRVCMFVTVRISRGYRTV